MAGKKKARKEEAAKAKKFVEEEALRLIQEQQQKRITMCQAEIQEVLQRYKCNVTAEILLRQGQVIPNVVIVPTPQKG